MRAPVSLLLAALVFALGATARIPARGQDVSVPGAPQASGQVRPGLHYEGAGPLGGGSAGSGCTGGQLDYTDACNLTLHLLGIT
ncbi:MAG: hypothetical protein IT481_08500 [Gammaproteobacteria bacterium]|nr:hypothetical protein [Gammaproteobacteria bacterium]